MRRITVVLLLQLFSCAVYMPLCSAVSVCQECGYEFEDETARFCSHCGAKRNIDESERRPGTSDVVSLQPGEEPAWSANEKELALSDKNDIETIEIADKAAISDMELGYKAIKARNYAYAVLALRNAEALSRIGSARVKPPAHEIGENREQLPNRVYRPAVLTDEQKLAVSKGISDSLSKLAFEGEKRVLPCSGRKSVRIRPGVMRTIDETQNVIPRVSCAGKKISVFPHVSNSVAQKNCAAAKMRFAGKMREQGRIPLGSAWIPKELEGKLSVQIMQRIAAAAAEPCPQCCGTMLSDCVECEGRGYVKCTNCYNGKITVTVSENKSAGAMGNLSRLRRPNTRIVRVEDVAIKTKPVKKVSVRQQPCPVCDGTGYVLCEKCGGVGAGPCTLCGGTGRRAPCTLCWGSGLGKIYVERQCIQQLCERCGGEGVEPRTDETK